MIDPHAHLRDSKEYVKETIFHGLRVAHRAGIDAVFEMPNTKPALTTEKNITDRLKLADKVVSELAEEGRIIFHALYAGITADPKQIKEVVRLQKGLFPRVIGLKMFSGQSTGNMGIIEEKEQRIVYRTLAEEGYTGVLVNHCEKESCFNPGAWNYKNPLTHTLARGPLAEINSIADQIKFAQEEGFKGTLHIAHISTPDSLALVLAAKKAYIKREYSFKVTCELTSHHALLYDLLMNETDGLLLKMNPPLRTQEMQEQMLAALLKGDIDYIATDHAPHKLEQKQGETAASGIPGFPYFPAFLQYLHNGQHMSESTIYALTHTNILNQFGLTEEDIPNSKRVLGISKDELKDLRGEYEFDAFKSIPLD